MIYLDHAATTPVPQAVADTMYEVLRNQYANPSAQYKAGDDMRKQVAQWRETVAAALDCPPERLFFTSCGTEGDVWAIRSACWRNRRLGRHIVTTAVEHNAVLETLQWMRQDGYDVTYIQPRADGSIDADKVLSAVRPDTALVSVMLVNNELGNRYPAEDIAQRLRDKNPDTLFHTDAVQGFLKVPFSARTSGADFVAVSAHKIGGPKGIGALYIAERVANPRPLLPGGGQESGFRSGTEATAQIAGFAKAVELRAAVLADTLAHIADIRAYAVEKLSAIPDMTIISPNRDAAPHILSIALSGWPSQNIVNDLSAQDICVSAGSACHKGKLSHVVKALNLPPRTQKSVIRLSFGPETSRADIDICADALRRHHDERFPML
ncbi:MAG: cysteine desulfurase [Oscillibacter sp.]|nr:cysteine desulfurase [Oscillibacter sp.]